MPNFCTKSACISAAAPWLGISPAPHLAFRIFTTFKGFFFLLPRPALRLFAPPMGFFLLLCAQLADLFFGVYSSGVWGHIGGGSFPCSIETYRVLAGPYLRGGAPKRRALTRRRLALRAYKREESPNLGGSLAPLLVVHHAPPATLLPAGA
jgi:hypothetical protein